MSSRRQRIRDLLASTALRTAEIQPQRPEAESLWCRDNLAGRLVEISGRGAAASLTAAVGLVRGAPLAGEPAAWIGLPGSFFFPPDVARSGVDLASLAVVRAPHPRAAARAADRLIRSGAFGLVVLDLVAGERGISTAAQGRLVGLAQKHDTALICLTDKSAQTPSLGSMVSLRVEAVRELTKTPGRYRCKLSVLKDKQRGPGREHEEDVRGPAGLR